MKVNEADTQIICPEPSCTLHVPEDVVGALCTPHILAKYRNYVVESFVNESRTTVWCPRAACGLAVDVSTSASKYVTCAQVRVRSGGSETIPRTAISGGAVKASEAMLVKTSEAMLVKASEAMLVKRSEA
eukprot:3589461-Pyramimonas_sp.AAC.1